MLDVLPRPVPARSDVRRRYARPRPRRAWATVAVILALGAALVATLLLVATTERSADSGAPGLGLAHGVVPDGGVGLDSDLPAITRLDPALIDALADAAADALARDGLVLEIASGWRSADLQRRLLDEAIATHGDEETARRFVASPETSSHVTGDAVDVGPIDLQFWLLQHGADYGLCQTYANERWHWELATSPGGICPEMLPDATAPRP